MKRMTNEIKGGERIMDQVYADLLTLLDHAAQSELPEGITADNVRYIKSVVSSARNGVATAVEA